MFNDTNQQGLQSNKKQIYANNVYEQHTIENSFYAKKIENF